MAIYDDLKSAGVPLDNHESDLYALVTPESTRIVQAHTQAHGGRGMITTFVSSIDGKRWYDIPFAYLPFWEKVKERGNAKA